MTVLEKPRKIKHVYKQRLLKLANFLHRLPKRYFDMNVITAEAGDPESMFGIRYKKKVREALEAFNKPECGAVACAIGWSPACFPRQLRWNKELNVSFKHGTCRTDSFGTARKFFNLSKREVQYLFMPDHYDPNSEQITPKDVAARIRDFVRDGDIDDSVEDSYSLTRLSNKRPYN